MISFHSAELIVQSPKFGWIEPDSRFIAVDLPIPLGPNIPTTCFSLGAGSLNNLNPF